MITTCEACQARYRLDASKVPPRKIRVRCPDCGAVFELDGARPGAATPETPVPSPAPASASAPTERAPAPTSGSDDLVLEPASAAAVVETPPVDHAAPAAAARQDRPAAGVATAEPPRGVRRRRRDKNEMLARALVSDILVYNREARDQALAEGNLLEALGTEIKKSWELYKEKVGTETATSTTYFKDALNEILAEGQHVF